MTVSDTAKEAKPAEGISTTEAAQMLGVTGQTVRNYMRKGQLAYWTLPSGQFRVYRASVEAMRGQS